MQLEISMLFPTSAALNKYPRSVDRKFLLDKPETCAYNKNRFIIKTADADE
jgi:hypothetical protein